jgi:chemotaxis signal transduction protein
MLRRSGPGEERGAAASLRPHVVFTCGAVSFAFDAVHARHVLRGDERAPEGLVRFLDQPYPVVDLRRVFGHPASGRTGFVVLVESRVRAGLHVDDLRGLRRIDPGGLEPLPAVYRGTERRWIAGLVPTDDSVDNTVIVVVHIAEMLETLLPGDGLGAAQ